MVQFMKGSVVDAVCPGVTYKIYVSVWGADATAQTMLRCFVVRHAPSPDHQSGGSSWWAVGAIMCCADPPTHTRCPCAAAGVPSQPHLPGHLLQGILPGRDHRLVSCSSSLCADRHVHVAGTHCRLVVLAASTRPPAHRRSRLWTTSSCTWGVLRQVRLLSAPAMSLCPTNTDTLCP